MYSNSLKNVVKIQSQFIDRFKYFSALPSLPMRLVTNRIREKFETVHGTIQKIHDQQTFQVKRRRLKPMLKIKENRDL